jgi:hypothetical protein
MKKIMFILTAGLAFLAAGQVLAQVPSAIRSTTNQKQASGGRFGGDIDNYMDPRGWSGIAFDRHFVFLGGRYQGDVIPAFGYATRLGKFYLGTYFKGKVIQGANSSTNGAWDSSWDADGYGSSKFIVNDCLAVLFGAPGIGGFRFDWIASTDDGSSGPAFEKFKDKGAAQRQINGELVDYAQGESSGSMSFVLNWGNVFFGKLKTDAAFGFAMPDTVDVTGGQVGTDIFTYSETKNWKIYGKLGAGWNLDSTSSVDGDYSFVIMPGMKWKQTKGATKTSWSAEGNLQNIINLNYSKTFKWVEKIDLKIKPNIGFDILFEQDVVETESGTVDKGNQTTLKITPAVSFGVQYAPIKRLSLYTGTTVTLFNYYVRSGEKGPDGLNAFYIDGNSSDIANGVESGFDIGASFAPVDSFSIDFNVRHLITGIFQSMPVVDLFLTLKK